MKLLVTLLLLVSLGHALDVATKLIGCLKRHPNKAADWMQFSNEEGRFTHASDLIGFACTPEAVTRFCRFYYKDNSVGFKMNSTSDEYVPSLGRKRAIEIHAFQVFGCIEEKLPEATFGNLEIFVLVAVLLILVVTAVVYFVVKARKEKNNQLLYVNPEDLMPTTDRAMLENGFSVTG